MKPLTIHTCKLTDEQASALLAALKARNWKSREVPYARFAFESDKVIVVFYPAKKERDGKLVGFVTVDPDTMYLDQIVVAPEVWGTGVADALLADAMRLSPKGLDLLVNKDNYRAIRFYEKHGFSYAGEDKNPVSGTPVNRMSWRATS